MSMIVNAFSKWYFNKLSSRLAKVGKCFYQDLFCHFLFQLRYMMIYLHAINMSFSTIF